MIWIVVWCIGRDYRYHSAHRVHAEAEEWARCLRHDGTLSCVVEVGERGTVEMTAVMDGSSP